MYTFLTLTSDYTEGLFVRWSLKISKASQVRPTVMIVANHTEISDYFYHQMRFLSIVMSIHIVCLKA